MADKAIFEIVVTDKGLKVTQKNIDGLGKSVQKTNEKVKEATETSKDYYDKQNKGVIGTANSTKSFSKLQQTIGGSNGLVAAYAGLAANAFAVSAAFNALNRAAQAEILMQGLVEQGARAGRTLTVLSRQIKGITRDSISSAEAMQATALASTAGISSTDLQKITKVATEASIALGRNVPDSLNRMVLAITKMEPELVDELGLTTKITEASERYARQLGISVSSMSQAQKQQALLNAWVEQGTLKYDGLAESVDANPYEKLAATFDNLIKSILTVTNTALKPFLSILSSSQGALAGFGLVFLGSIRNQILPGLKEASGAALAQANEAKDAAVKALSGTTTLVSGKRKAINEYIQASKEGIATQAQYDAAYNESKAREEAIDKRINQGKLKNSKTIERLRAKEKEEQQKLNTIKEAGAKASISQAQADGYAASEGVNITNAYSKFKDTLKATGAAYSASYNGSKTAAKGLSGLANTAAAAGKGIAAAGKVAAVGFLNFIPVIGQVIAVVSILWDLFGRDIWARITGRTEAVTAALDNFSEVVESTSKKLNALERIQVSTASASDRAVAIINNQAATIYELADAYQAVIDAQREAQREEENSQKANSRAVEIQRELIEARRQNNLERVRALEQEQRDLRTADRLGVAPGSRAAQAFSAQGTEFWMNDEYIAAAQTLENLEKANRGAADAFYELNGGVQAFNQLDPEEKVRRIYEEMKTLGTVTRNLETSFKSLQNAIKGLNSGYVDFIKSITPTTEYDNIVSNFDAFNKSLGDTRLAIMDMEAVGGDATELQNRLAETITGFEGPARNIFSGPTREALNYFDTVDRGLQANRAKLEQMSRGDAGYSELQEEINKQTSERNSLLEANFDIITREVSAYNKIVADAQIEQITRQGTLAIAQAHLGVIQRQGIITGEDVEKQMRAENAILALQQAQLQAQITILETDIEREQSALNLLKTNEDILNNIKEQTEAQRRQSIEVRREQINTELAGLGTSGADLEKRARLAAEKNVLAQAERDINRAILQNQIDQETTEASIAQKQAGIVALRQQSAALGMQMNTEAEILAGRLKKEAENRKKLRDIENDILSIRYAMLDTQDSINNLFALGANTLQNQLSSIQRQADLKRDQLDSEFTLTKEILQLEIQRAQAAGNISQVNYYTELLRAETDRNNIASERITLEQRSNTLNAIAIKTLEEENSLRRTSLELTQKLQETNRSVIESSIAYIEALEKLDRKRRGAQETEEFNNTTAIRAAAAAADLAASELASKTALIRLEFTLLKAQALQQQADLRLRAERLRERAEELRLQEEANAAARTARQQNRQQIDTDENTILVTGRDSTETSSSVAAQADLLEQTATNIGTVIGGSTGSLIDDAMNNAITAAERNAETLKINLQTLLEPGPRIVDSWTTTFNKIDDIVNNYTTRLREAQNLTADEEPIFSFRDKVAMTTDIVKTYVDSMRSAFEELGPEGQLVLSIMDGVTNISDSIVTMFDRMNAEGATTADKMAAGFAAAAAIIGSIMSILNAASNARIARIDKEIAAEEKRDGKSQASVAKIEAMEKKKDAMAKKQFNTNKKLMLAQAVMSTAAGVSNALATPAPYPIPVILAGIIGAMGAAQLAIIAGTSYESSYSPKSVETPSSISIGKRSDTVNLAMGPNANAGGEAGFIRGSSGVGSNAYNYSTIGSAYGGPMERGYGNRGFIVGEKGPELITPETPISVTPADQTGGNAPVNATINIQAIDSQGVQDVLVAQKGNIIQMLRQAANASGQRFLEDVNVNVYTRPSVGKLL